MRAKNRVRTVAVLLLLALFAGCTTNPVTGKKDFALVGSQQELALGDQAHPNIILMYDGEYDDPELERYLGTIVQRLHDSSHRPGMPVDFTILNTSVINAFATPGHVYATRGFLARVENEAQFASVMAHEWAHVAARHSARQMSHGLAANLLLGVGGSLMGDTGAAQVATQLAAVGVTLLGLQYSRSQEHQADRVGTYYMALAGWDPQQAVEMMKILGSLNEHRQSMLDKYLSTHPRTGERIADIRRVIREKRLDDRWVQGDGVFADRWQRFLAGLIEDNEDFEPYDRGTKALAEDRFQEALELAEEAIERDSQFAQFHRLKGDALLGLGRTGPASESYRRALSLYPRYEPAALGLGRVALQTGRYGDAERQFQRVTENWPGSVNAHYGLGMALYRQDKFQAAIPPLESVVQATRGQPRPDVLYVLASSYDRVGRNENAIRAYDMALQAGLTGNQRERAIARIKTLRAALPKPQ